MKVVTTVLMTPEERITILKAIDYIRIIGNRANIFDDEIESCFVHTDEFNRFLDNIRDKVDDMPVS